MKNTFLPETHKFVPAAEVLKNFKSSKDAVAPLSDIEKKIAKLEEEAAIRMAIDTFLDCNNEEVKVRRMAKPRKTECTFPLLNQLYNTSDRRGTTRGKGYTATNERRIYEVK